MVIGTFLASASEYRDENDSGYRDGRCKKRPGEVARDHNGWCLEGRTYDRHFGRGQVLAIWDSRTECFKLSTGSDYPEDRADR